MLCLFCTKRKQQIYAANIAYLSVFSIVFYKKPGFWRAFGYSTAFFAFFWRSGLHQLVQKAAAACKHIPPGGLKVAGVPRVGDLAAGPACVFHQEMDLFFQVAAADALDIMQVGAVHADEQVGGLIVRACELPGGVALAGDAVLGELAPCGRIDGIAELFAARRGAARRARALRSQRQGRR